jgi:hypothetical protein
MLNGVPDRFERLDDVSLPALIANIKRMGVGKRALHRAAKASGISPRIVWMSYLAGQVPGCQDRFCVRLAWEVDQIRADKAAANAARIERAADAGESWAIQHIDKALDAEPYEAGLSEDEERALLGAMAELFESENRGPIRSVPSAPPRPELQQPEPDPPSD